MTDREAFEHWASDEGKHPKAVERAGDGYRLAFANNGWWVWQAAVKHEREACAKECEEVEEPAWYGYENPNSFDDGTRAAAAAIRSRAANQKEPGQG